MDNPVIQSLEAISQNGYRNNKNRSQIVFTYDAHSNGPYGIEGSRWQAAFKTNSNAIIDYGATLDEAAQRLLDRLQHPEKYPEPKDD